MEAEIIAVGTELLLGDILNTNAQFLSRELAALGITVHFQTVVGDNPARLESVVRQARGRSDLLVFSGGLGPTEDDLTKQTVARAFGDTLRFDEAELEKIRAFFTAWGRTMPENNKKQAMMPQGCIIFPNNNGTAPGCAIEGTGEQQGKTAPTRVECSADITVAAYIPESYVPAARQRMDLYRRIAALRTPEDESELTDELLDRYGDVPPPVTALLRVALLRAAAMDCGVTDITQKGRQLVFSFDDRVDPAALLAVCTMAAYRSRAQLSAGAAPRLTLYMQPGEEPLAAAGAVVEALRLHQADTQQMNGAQTPEEAKHEE